MATDLITADRSTWPVPAVSVLEKMEAGATYSEALLACAGKGSSLAELRREVRRLRETNAAIARAFLVLEAERADGWLDEVIDIADMAAMDNTAIAHANLRINTRMRVAELRNAERYKTKPDKVTVNVGVMEGPKFVFVGMEPEHVIEGELAATDGD
jgi:hypothetical protein